jgi:phenylacetate-CoA ligase
MLSDKCRCGRNSRRVGPILGRKAHMLKYKGTKLYPRAIENALTALPEVKNYVIEAFTGDDFSDRIIVKISSASRGNGFIDRVSQYITSQARVIPEIQIALFDEIEALITNYGQNRKPRLFIDHRVNAVVGE